MIFMSTVVRTLQLIRPGVGQPSVLQFMVFDNLIWNAEWAKSEVIVTCTNHLFLLELPTLTYVQVWCGALVHAIGRGRGLVSCSRWPWVTRALRSLELTQELLEFLHVSCHSLVIVWCHSNWGAPSVAAAAAMASATVVAASTPVDAQPDHIKKWES